MALLPALHVIPHVIPSVSPRPIPRALASLLTGALLITLATSCQAQAPDFSAWLEGLRQEATARGVSQGVLDAALGNVQPLPRVLELDRRQPEFTDTFLNYLDRRVTPERVEAGRKLLRTHGPLLNKIARKYGVPPHVLVAFWGLETHYGTVLGSHPVPAALATLAHYPRRAGFFRAQLLDALDILQAGHIEPQAMVGSWAGAMGHLQFMPATFQAHAVDQDGDGRKDLWNSLPDAFASGANYLHALGWKRGDTWGREVRLPVQFDWRQAALGQKKSLAQWPALGVTRADGKSLPRLKKMQGAILLPQGHAGPAFLVYDNFDAILTWNRSVNYALAVGLLADQLVGLPPLRHGLEADNRSIPREDALALQTHLSQLGFYSGPLDGVLGSGTKTAIRAYQHQAGLAADGYPSLTLLEHLRQAGAVPAPPTPGQ